MSEHTIDFSQIRFRYSYCKIGQRRQVTTTINKDLHDKYLELMNSIGQPSTKGYDILLMDLFEDEKNIDDFIKKVKDY